MSSILKALRKVEDDKAALGEGSVDLAHDILKQDYRQSPLLSWPLVAGGSAILLLLIIGAWFWLLPEQQIEQTDMLAAQAGRRAPSVPVAVAAPAQQGNPAVAGSENTSVARKPTVEIPLLQVEEIIYQQDAAARLAVVNGLPVMEGTDIEGARVEKILTDRVQFLFQGVRFNKYKNE